MPTSALVSRKDVVELIRDLANLCRLDGVNHFKCAAYDRAADALSEMNDEYFEGLSCFDSVDGIGESISTKIWEILRCGSCELLDELRPKHGEKLELMSIKGIGAKTAQKFWDKGIRTVDDVVEQVKAGKIKTKRIVDGVNSLDMPSKVSLETAQEVADDLIADIMAKIGKHIGKIEACGSLRRQKEEVGDLDIVVQVLNSPVDIPALIASCLDSVRAQGDLMIAGRYCDMNVQVRLASVQSYGAMLLYFTGPKHFNIKMRYIASRHGNTLNEYGLWTGNGVYLAGEEEANIFEALHLPFVPPEKRKDFNF